MKRRTWLRLIGASAVAAAGAYLAHRRWWPSVAAAPWARDIVDYYGRDEASLQLGELYAASPVAMSTSTFAIPEDEPVPWLQARIEEDFRDGRTLFVGGWVVAETEANLCAWLRRP
jgi:hypothetical protein